MTAETQKTDGNDGGAPKQIERLSFWPNIAASFKYIRESVKEEGSRIRKSDPLTIWMVPATAIMLVVVSLTAGWLRCITGVVALVAVWFYILARFGIVRSMNHRQVNLVWHIILASFLAGILFAFTFLELIRQ